MVRYIQAMGSQRVRHDGATELMEKGDMLEVATGRLAMKVTQRRRFRGRERAECQKHWRYLGLSRVLHLDQ